MNVSEAKELLDICDRYESTSSTKTTTYWMWGSMMVASVTIPVPSRPGGEKPVLELYQLRDQPRSIVIVLAMFQGDDISELINCGNSVTK